jgi:hypothetical protein
LGFQGGAARAELGRFDRIPIPGINEEAEQHMKVLRLAILGLTVLWAVALVILYLSNCFYRRVVVNQPMEWTPGLSKAVRFQVDVAAPYWVGVEYEDPDVNRIRPTDEFSASFQISHRGVAIISGTEKTVPSSAGPWRVNRNMVTRYLGKFDAHPNEPYELAFGLESHSSSSRSRNPHLVVECDWRYDDTYDLRLLVVVCVSVLVVAVASIALGIYLSQKRRVEKRGQI